MIQIMLVIMSFPIIKVGVDFTLISENEEHMGFIFDDIDRNDNLNDHDKKLMVGIFSNLRLIGGFLSLLGVFMFAVSLSIGK